ncbi:hypothetical protein ACFLUP_04790 [Chloroflexota bacterium]
MSSQSNWQDGITERINQLKETLNEKDYKKYKLNLLLCVAQRVSEFSPECGQCQIAQQDISTLAQDLGYLVQTADKDRRKTHLKAIDRIVSHLRKEHKLVTEGHYMGIGMVFGSSIGVALGAIGDNVGSGIPIGVGIGIAIGAALDAKAKKEGRVICPSDKTKTSTPKTRMLIKIGLGALVLGGLIAFLLYRLLF